MATTTRSCRSPPGAAVFETGQGRDAEGYKGGLHGICTTQDDAVNADLLAFIKR